MSSNNNKMLLTRWRKSPNIHSSRRQRGLMMDTKNPWTDEERALLRAIWNTDTKVSTFGDMFPGRLADSVYSMGRKIMKLGPRRVPQNFDAFLSWKRVYAQLELGPKTARQLSICTGLDLSKILEMLRKRKGRLVRVCEWTAPARGGRQQIWAIGNAPCARAPQKLTRTEISNRYREKMKRDRPEEVEAYSKKKKVREKIKQEGFARRDVAASWF